MKKTGKLLTAILAVLIFTMIPGTAFARDNGRSGKCGRSYVPTAGTGYTWDEAKNAWIPSGETFKAVFNQQGKVKSLSVVWKSDDAREKETLQCDYQWKGDNISRETVKYVSSSDGKADESYSLDMAYKIRQNKPVEEKDVCCYYDNSGQLAASLITEIKYVWNKNNKKGSSTIKVTSRGKDSKDTYTKKYSDEYTLVKGRLAATREENYSYRYYKNGNLKSITKTSTDRRTRSVTEFNEAGYRIKYSYSSKGADGADRGYVTTYKWSVVNGEPKSVEMSTKDQDGNISDRYRYQYTRTKEVAQSRNCDAFGFEVWLGTWGE